MYDPLIWQPGGRQFVPGLAEKWEICRREDLHFHAPQDEIPRRHAVERPGRQGDVQRITDPALSRSKWAASVPTAPVADDYTVRIVLKEPFTPLLSNLSEHALAPASMAAVQKLGDKYAMNPVARGPFRAKEWAGRHHLCAGAEP